MEHLYIPDSFIGYGFEPDYKQIFQNKWTLNIAHNEIIKMRNNGFISDKDMKIVKFLFRFTFSTAEMMFRYLGEESKVENVTARLEKLVKNKILNKFMLSRNEGDTLAHDALHIYCLDVGGKTLLTNYSNEDTTNWYTTKNMKASELIGKDLGTANFYIKLMETCPDKVKYFKQCPEYRIGRTIIIPSFEMGMIINGQLKYFIGEVVRDFDFPMYFRDRVSRLDSILSTNAWKKYYYDSDQPPVLFLFCENDKNALDTSQMIAGTTTIDAYRLTTDERLKNVLYEGGTFLKYEKDLDILKAVKATTFDPEH